MEVKEISVESIEGFPGNRAHGGFDEQKLAELADDITVKGIIQPATVRPINGEGKYQLVCGERRWRASMLAGKETLPCLVRELDDVAALTVHLSENNHEETDPLDDSDCYQTLLEKTGGDVKEVAAKVGRHPSHVYRRLRLRNLIDGVKEKLDDGQIGISHALEISVLPEKAQKDVVRQFGSYWRPTVAQLKEWISSNVYLDLGAASFSKKDTELHPKAGSCTQCPKRTGYEPTLFPEITKRDFCLDGACFKKKLDAYLARKREEMKDPEHLEITGDDDYTGKLPEGALNGRSVNKCKKGDPGAKTALIVTGKDRGKTRYVRDRSYEQQEQRAAEPVDPEQEKRWREQRIENRVDQELDHRLFEEVVTRERKILTEKLTRRQLITLAWILYEDLWHHEWIDKLHGWDFDRTAEDSDAVFRKTISEMDEAGLRSLVVECALVEDHNVNNYNGSSEISNLVKEHHINERKLRKEVRKNVEKEVAAEEAAKK